MKRLLLLVALLSACSAPVEQQQTAPPRAAIGAPPVNGTCILRCADPGHAARKGRAGWAETLGTRSAENGQCPTRGEHFCNACRPPGRVR